MSEVLNFIDANCKCSDFKQHSTNGVLYTMHRHRHSTNGIKPLKLLTSITTTIETFLPSVYKVLFSTRDQTGYL